jgi:hypothetical protein
MLLIALLYIALQNALVLSQVPVRGIADAPGGILEGVSPNQGRTDKESEDRASVIAAASGRVGPCVVRVLSRVPYGMPLSARGFQP